MINIKKYKIELEDLLSDIDSNLDFIKQELINRKKPISKFVREKNNPGVYAFFYKTEIQTRYLQV